jgi:hypothetical protein
VNGESPRSEPDWRWVETDPWGLAVHCAEVVWTAKVRQHPDIAAHEAAIRATVRAPDAVYDDPASTARLRPTGGRVATIQHYVGRGRLPGHPRVLVTVVVKVLREPPAPAAASPGAPGDVPAVAMVTVAVGYVQTTYLASHLPSRLHLRWSRNP